MELYTGFGSVKNVSQKCSH